MQAHYVIPITYRISEFGFKIDMFYVLLKIGLNVPLLWKVHNEKLQDLTLRICLPVCN